MSYIHIFNAEIGKSTSDITKYPSTVKFLNFGTPEIFAVIHLKFKQRGKTLKAFCQNGANGITNSEDPDQTAPLGAVRGTV